MRHLIIALFLLSATAAACAAERPYRVETVASGLDHPWSLAFLPDGRLLVTERAGRLRVIENGKLMAAPVSGVPQAWSHRQGGLMEVLPAPDFAKSRRIFLSLAHRGAEGGGTTRVVSGRLDGTALLDVKTVFTADPPAGTGVHYGGRLAWMDDGTLLIALGDGYQFRELAQDLSTHYGKLVRVNADGSVPKDNPFVGRQGVKPEIYSYGHRNMQGLVVDAGGKIYAHEHGPRGGDELSLIQPGRNYGWPVITYGVDYSGAIISPFTHKPGMEQPLLHWTPSVAPAGMALIRGSKFKAWQGDLLVSTLSEQSVRRVDLQDGKVVGQEVLFAELGERLRDVREGPDGALYLLTDANAGKVLRVVPR